MNQDENVKSVVDAFGHLSFLLETAVKLHTTKDSVEIKRLCFRDAQIASENLTKRLSEINFEGHE